MELRFDHCYTADKNFRFRKKLEKAGFFLGDSMVEHPGKHFCKFIMMPKGDDPRSQYIEFVHVGRGGLEVDKPGLSLAATGALEPFANKLVAKGMKALFIHKNYQWKTNNVDRLPGWNFINFPRHKSKIYTWLTEYEPDATKKKLTKKSFVHPNQVFRIVSLDLTLAGKDIELFKQLGAKRTGDKFELSQGTSFTFQTGKRSRINSVVFATKDIRRLVKKFEWDELAVYEGKPGVLIKNPDEKMWNVIIVQK